MSHTPTTTSSSTTSVAGNVQAATSLLSQQQQSQAAAATAAPAAAKPSLTGVRIKQRKGQAKATAKFEPEVFRDSLLLHLALLSTPPTTDELVSKLVQAGTTLEFLKYSEQLFELLFVGGLLQPGGSYLDDKRSPVYVLQPTEEGSTGGWEPVSGIVEVLKRVIQRYKYLQKPLEDSFLPDLLSYTPKWSTANRVKLANAVARLVVDLQINPKCLQSLTRDHVVKDGVALEFLTQFYKAFTALSIKSSEGLAGMMRRSGVKDVLAIFPANKRSKKDLENHFKAEGLPQIVEWYDRVALAEVKDQTIALVVRMINDEETNDQIIEAIRTQQSENPVLDADLCEWIWQAWMLTMDFTARADQLDAAIVQHVTRLAPTLEPFCNGAKAQVGILNAVQVYCYTDTRVMKSFPQLVKILYNSDCISDQAIIYWHQKGAKPQGKQHFLKVTEALVKFLEEQDSDEDE